jgi:hypothetical protein
MHCNVVTEDEKDKVTGEVIRIADHNQLNKDNKCKYFKKSWFGKKSEVIQCCNCKHWEYPTY